MPSKTPAQAKLMRAVAHGWKPDRIKGPSRKVAQEFVAADKKAKGYAFGGSIIKKLMREAQRKVKGKLGEEKIGSEWEKLLTEGGDRPGGSIGKTYQEAIDKLTAQQAEQETAVTRPWERGEGPRWDEYLIDLAPPEGQRAELIGPRTAGAPALDPSRYRINIGTVGEDFEGEVDTSGHWGKRRDAARIAELKAQGYTQGTGRESHWFAPPTGRAWDPSSFADVPPREIQPIPGEGGLLEETPPSKTPAPELPSLRAEIPERLRGMVAGAGRAPSSLQRYLASLEEPEPVEMQYGGMMSFLNKGRVPPMQQAAGRGQPPGGGLARAAVMPGGQFLTEGRVPGGGGQFKGMGRGMNSLLQKMQQRRQAPGGGGQGQPRPQPAPGPTRGPEWGGSPEANQKFADAIRNRGVAGPQPQVPQRPGAGVPMRGVGRPPGMGRPGAGGGQGMMRPAVMPGRGFMPGGGGAGTPSLPPGGGAAPRIGAGDQQGAQARALQVQTGRPPMSRRQPFPGRGGPGGGFGRRRRGRGRMRR